MASLVKPRIQPANKLAGTTAVSTGSNNQGSATGPVVVDKMTIEEAQKAMPLHLKNSVTQELVDRINTAASEPEVVEIIAGNFLGWSQVLNEGRFKVGDYLNAVQYVSYKLMGFSNQRCWELTFPQRVQTLLAKGAGDQEISAYVSVYNKTKMVTLLLEQSLVPHWIMNQSIFQEAVIHQYKLMLNAKSEKVQNDAASNLIDKLRPPEIKKMEIGIGVKETSGMTELRELMGQLGAAQRQAIGEGVQTREITHQKLAQTTVIDPEAEDAEYALDPDAGDEEDDQERS